MLLEKFFFFFWKNSAAKRIKSACNEKKTFRIKSIDIFLNEQEIQTVKTLTMELTQNSLWRNIHVIVFLNRFRISKQSIERQRNIYTKS